MGDEKSPIFLIMLKDEIMIAGNLPRHVAIILDGNGRWAEERNLPRIRGHMEGAKRVEEISSAAAQLGIEALTLYVFSTENWQRPRQEVSMLMNLLCTLLEKKLQKFIENDVRLKILGRRDGVPPEVLKVLDESVEKTKDRSGMILNLAFNYGARTEILDAVKTIISEFRENGKDLDSLTEQDFSRYLYTRELPDPDLLIRTSGEQRISNFLLWQLSYAEFYFTSKLWPEFDVDEFHKAILEFQKRNRRFGNVMQGMKPKHS